MELAELTVLTRFCGPPGAANGGYVAGLLGSFATETVAVRLRLPTPLGVALTVRSGAGGTLELRHAEQLVATATAATVAFAAPRAMPEAVAAAAAANFRGFHGHAYPRCFVCGPERDDGLRVFAGPAVHDGRACVAAPWQPDESLAGTRRAVRPEFLWAALDCPGYFAVQDEVKPMLLGTFTCQVEDRVLVGERCVVVGWKLGQDGRKHHAATALYGADGRCVARAEATWVELRPTP